jgi:hypothetical protein
MSNASTIRRQVSGTQQLTIAPLSGAVITTTETAFQLNNNALTLTGGGVIPLSAGVTGLYQGTGQVLWIHAAGTYSGVTSSTLEIELQQVPASLLPIASTLSGAQTFTNWNEIGTSGAVTVSTTTGSFSFDAYVQLDAAGNLEGDYSANVDGTTKAQTIITPITGLVGEQDLNFVLTAVLGASIPGALVTLSEFSLNFV